MDFGRTKYSELPIGPAEFCSRNEIQFLIGEVIKRCCAYHLTNDANELKKAIHELELELHFRGLKE